MTTTLGKEIEALRDELRKLRFELRAALRAVSAGREQREQDLVPDPEAWRRWPYSIPRGGNDL